MTKSKGWLAKLGLRRSSSSSSPEDGKGSSLPQGPDTEPPEFNQQFAQFGGGYFWGVELAFQRVVGVTKTQVGYSQGHQENPTYTQVNEGVTGHAHVVRVTYDPNICSFEDLLQVFWSCHDPTSLKYQDHKEAAHYRSGIYYYTAEQEKVAKESMENRQKSLEKSIVTEILPARRFYRAEACHQQYLAKGGRFGFRQSAAKGCKDPIRPYG